MKKFFVNFGLIIIFLFSFIYTNRAISVIKEYDDIMINIKKNKIIQFKEIEPTIKKNTIIPGKNGLEIDINKSYSKMRKIGFYSKEYLEYKKIPIKNTLMKNRDKLIINGNLVDNNVSIIILLKKNDDIFMNIDNISYFANEDFILKNKKKVDGIFNFNNIKKILSFVDNKYCLYEKNNYTECFFEGFMNIKSNITKKNFFNDVKKNLKNGKIFIFESNNELNEELNIIYTYIKNKGYNIVKINDLLKE